MKFPMATTDTTSSTPTSKATMADAAKVPATKPASRKEEQAELIELRAIVATQSANMAALIAAIGNPEKVTTVAAKAVTKLPPVEMKKLNDDELLSLKKECGKFFYPDGKKDKDGYKKAMSHAKTKGFLGSWNQLKGMCFSISKNREEMARQAEVDEAVEIAVAAALAAK